MRCYRFLAVPLLVASVSAEGTDLFSPAIREAYVSEAAAALREQAPISPDFEAWLKKHPEIWTGLLVSGDPVLPRHAANLDALRQAVGPERADRYAALLLAVSLRPADPPPSAPAAPDPRVGIVAAYMKAEGLDMIRAREMGDALFSAAKTDAPSKKDAGAFWEELAHATGTYPRRESMSLEDSLKLLLDRYETKLGPFEGGPSWPLYPIDETPWPLLAPLRQTLPRGEADYIWDRFRGDPPYADGSRWKTYARYAWDYERDPAVRWKQSPFHPNSIPRIAEDGGVCGRLSTLGQYSCAALGKPAVGMYQPGHRAMLSYNRDANGTWFARMEQSITGPERSTNQWFLPAPSGARVSGTDEKGVKTGVEWHVALNLAMNVGLQRWTDARIALFSARRLHGENPAMAAKLAGEATRLNPYLLDAWYQLAAWSADDLEATNRLLERLDALLLDPSKARMEDEELSASTDFNRLKPLKGGADPKRDSTLVANMVADAIVSSAYGPALAEKSAQGRGYEFLGRELARREALKMPYGAGVKDLHLKFEVAVKGPRPAQQRMEQSVREWPQVAPKRRGKAAPELTGRIAAVASGLPDAKARADWFARLQDGLPREVAVTRSKDGKVAVDPLYKSLHDLQVREFKSLGKSGARELKRLQKSWEEVTAG